MKIQLTRSTAVNARPDKYFVSPVAGALALGTNVAVADPSGLSAVADSAAVSWPVPTEISGGLLSSMTSGISVINRHGVAIPFRVLGGTAVTGITAQADFGKLFDVTPLSLVNGTQTPVGNVLSAGLSLIPKRVIPTSSSVVGGNLVMASSQTIAPGYGLAFTTAIELADTQAPISATKIDWTRTSLLPITTVPGSLLDAEESLHAAVTDLFTLDLDPPNYGNVVNAASDYYLVIPYANTIGLSMVTKEISASEKEYLNTTINEVQTPWHAVVIPFAHIASNALWTSALATTPSIAWKVKYTSGPISSLTTTAAGQVAYSTQNGPSALSLIQPSDFATAAITPI